MGFDFVLVAFCEGPRVLRFLEPTVAHSQDVFYRHIGLINRLQSRGLVETSLCGQGCQARNGAAIQRGNLVLWEFGHMDPDMDLGALLPDVWRAKTFVRTL